MRTEPTTRAGTLDAPLERLAALGLECPRHWTLGRFFDLLVGERVLSAVAAREYLAARYEAEYAAAAVDPARAEAGVEAVLGELVRAAPSDLQGVVAKLAPAPRSPPEAGEELAVNAAVSTTAVDASGEAEPASSSAAPEPAAKRRSWRRLAVVAVAVVWSALMLGLGFAGRPLLARWWAELRVGVLGAPQLVTAEERLRAARERAARHPGATDAWLLYANRAEDLGRSSEAALALRHLVARDPEDPELLNNLAWLYCTAAEEVARDPVQALELAERAVALSRAPHIVDTLAEAAFQNGDVVRAVQLEEEALRGAVDNPEFYRRQLARFRAAAEEK